MPRYRVLKPGFINDVFHKPDDPRHNVVVTDKPLKPVPSWLKPIKKETAAECKARETLEADLAEQLEQDKENKQTVEVTSFADSPSAAGSKVTNL